MERVKRPWRRNLHLLNLGCESFEIIPRMPTTALEYQAAESFTDSIQPHLIPPISGVCKTLRRLFAKKRVNEWCRDLSPPTHVKSYNSRRPKNLRSGSNSVGLRSFQPVSATVPAHQLRLTQHMALHRTFQFVPTCAGLHVQFCVESI